MWAAAYVINGGCSDDGFDYFRGWLLVQDREVFERAVPDLDELADVAAVRLAVSRQAFLECESVLYTASQAHRVATGEELPAAAYIHGPAEPVGGWDFDFDDRAGMQRRLPRLTALCWR